MPRNKTENKSSEKRGTKPMAQYYRTSITLPNNIAEEIELRRGAESFSGQIALDLGAYWEACRSGITKLRNRFDKKEASLLHHAIDARNWGAVKVDEMALAELIENVKRNAAGDPLLDAVVTKMGNLCLVELLALLNWSRTCRQRNDSPETAVALFRDNI